MAQFTIYTNNDTSAPVLTGEVGSLIALLDACLVTGYGTMSGAGWTKPFTGTNKAAFKQGADSCGFYLRIDDSAASTGGARDAQTTGYITMSDVDTGSGQFPHPAIGYGGTNAFWNWRKSDSADSTPRPWILVADSRTVYLFCLPGSTIQGAYGFGDFFSLSPGVTDASRCFLSGTTANSTAALITSNSSLTNIPATNSWSSGKGTTVARGWGGFGAGLDAVPIGEIARGPTTGSPQLYGSMQIPNGPDLGYYLAPLWLGITGGSNQIRGRLRGFWHWLHPIASATHGDTFYGTGAQAGKTFLIIKQATNCVLVIEVSDTLETNAG